MNDYDEELWEQLIAEIRTWDRREHDWSVANKSKDYKNITTKERLIKRLMKKYKLEKQMQ